MLIKLLVASVVTMSPTLTLSAQRGTVDVAFQTVAKAGDSGLNNCVDEVITDDATWERVWTQITAIDPHPGPRPAVDFGRQMIILVSMGVQPTPGHSITVTRIVKVRNHFKVLVEESEPGTSCSPVTVIGRPYHVIVTELRPFVTFRRKATRGCGA
jgi:hypothetical protein